jgi:hypothetical protein
LEEERIYLGVALMQQGYIHTQEAEEEAYMCLQEQAASQTEELQVEVCSEH